MAHPASPTARAFAFGPFILFPERQLLLHGEAPVRIGSRAFDILVALVEASGAVVSKVTTVVFPAPLGPTRAIISPRAAIT